MNAELDVKQALLYILEKDYNAYKEVIEPLYEDGIDIDYWTFEGWLDLKGLLSHTEESKKEFEGVGDGIADDTEYVQDCINRHMRRREINGIDIVLKTYTGKRTFWQWMTLKPKIVINSEVTIYKTGTNELKETYTDSTGSTMNTNPVVLDYEGKARFWI